MRRLQAPFPVPSGFRRVVSGIIRVMRYGLQCKDAPSGGAGSACSRIFAALAAKGGAPEKLTIVATCLKSNRTAASLLQTGALDISYAPEMA